MGRFFEAESYWFVWMLSDIMSALLNAGLAIKLFKEYEKDISASHARNQNAGISIPLSYILVAGNGS